MSGSTDIALPGSSHIAEFHETVKLNLTFSENLEGFSSDSESVSLSKEEFFFHAQNGEKQVWFLLCLPHVSPKSTAFYY